MDPVQLLALINSSLSVLQGVMNFAGSLDQVSQIVSKRIAEKRDTWTNEEQNQVLQALITARQNAVDAVEKLP